MQNEYSIPQGFIDLVERKYKLKVIDSYYILTDEKNQRYHMMLDVQMNKQMKENFQKKYGKLNSDMYVDWDFQIKTNSIRFLAEKGNNILLLWDSLIDTK